MCVDVLIKHKPHIEKYRSLEPFASPGSSYPSRVDRRPVAISAASPLPPPLAHPVGRSVLRSSRSIVLWPTSSRTRQTDNRNTQSAFIYHHHLLRELKHQRNSRGRGGCQWPGEGSLPRNATGRTKRTERGSQSHREGAERRNHGGGGRWCQRTNKDTASLLIWRNRLTMRFGIWLSLLSRHKSGTSSSELQINLKIRLSHVCCGFKLV